MRLKAIRGLPVVDPTAARKIGAVADYFVDPFSQRLAALEVAPPEGGAAPPERVPAERIRRIGRHAVVLTGPPGGTRTHTSADAARWLDGSSLATLEVLGDDGNRVGYLADALVDQDTLEVQAFLLQGGIWHRLAGRRGTIEPEQVAACSRELMIVTTARPKETPAEPGAASPDEASDGLGVTLKVDDQPPAPSPPSQAVDGQPLPARARRD